MATSPSTFIMLVDEDGIPVSDYGIYRGKIAIGRQRSMLSVAERGLVYWNRFLRGDAPEVLLSYDWSRWPANKEREPVDANQAQTMLFNCADWLLGCIVSKPGYLIWQHPYPLSYDMLPGWRSAHTQAVGVQFLARAFMLSRDHTYLAPCDGLLSALDVTIDDGGVADKEGGLWFEKFAQEGVPRSHVLNGMMFALLALADVHKTLPSPLAGRLFSEGTNTLLRMLPRFDLGNWSAYDIFGRKASAHYHAIHIQQCLRLFQITGNEQFDDCAKRFQSYLAEKPRIGSSS